MNDKIIDKISELLQVSYDKAVELYPLLRTQFLWYELFNGIKAMTLGVVGVGTALLIGLIIGFGMDLDFFGTSDKGKLIRYLIYFIFFMLFICLVALIFNIMLAPDIVFVKGLLGGK